MRRARHVRSTLLSFQVLCLVLSKAVALVVHFCFFQAEDGIRDLVRSRGLGDVYKRQVLDLLERSPDGFVVTDLEGHILVANRSFLDIAEPVSYTHLTLPTSDLV